MPSIDPAADAAYTARAVVSPERFATLMARYRDESSGAVAGLGGTPGIAYDDASGELLDVWGTGDSPRPVFVFLHGGYWRALSRHDSAFMARALDAHGIATVVPDYTLAPAATLEEIVRQVRAAVAWVHREGAGYGLDPAHIVVGGSSAGGHLAAMTMVHGWQEDFGLPQDVIAGGFPISGLFDIRPLVRTHINDWLGLDEPRAAALSPFLLAAGTDRRCPAVVAVAERESSGFHEQSDIFHSLWTGEGDPLVVPDRDHFDVVLDLADPDTRLSRALHGLFPAK
ncbi:alpha/beta hydrolase [Yinghuangia sp. YIM S09857]|uniref:alpha/beta hydrolase n=1 Tax=Yinghuangia sp. YIM S09857 TaxID=3436929 RepID=UPI003F537894